MSEPTIAAPLAELSLADYRASRENPAVETTAKPETAEPSTAGVVDAVAEPAAEDAADDSTEQHTSDGKPAKKGGFQRKIERLSRENEDLKRQLAEKTTTTAAPAAEGREEPQAAAPALPEYDKPKPKLEDFDSIESYTDALTDWKHDKREFDKAQQAIAAKAQQESQQLLDRWTSGQDAMRESHADYDEVLAAVDDVKLSTAHQRAILESEHGAQLAYQLAQDREALEKFSQMSPLKAAQYLGKLEAALPQNAPQPKEPPVSKAPRPVRPITAVKAAGAVTPNVASMSLAEYRKAREAGRL